MAQHAAAETLTTLAGRELPSLFGPTAGDVQQAFAKLGSSDRFSVLARDFFSRLTSRSLGYFLSRELSKHVGPNKRFAAISELSDFNAALDLHCREASRIIKVPRIGRITVARGRDAADIALATSFGPHTLSKFRVWTEEIDDAVLADLTRRTA
jgi:hypothetical protein